MSIIKNDYQNIYLKKYLAHEFYCIILALSRQIQSVCILFPCNRLPDPIYVIYIK